MPVVLFQRKTFLFSLVEWANGQIFFSGDVRTRLVSHMYVDGGLSDFRLVSICSRLVSRKKGNPLIYTNLPVELTEVTVRISLAQ